MHTRPAAFRAIMSASTEGQIAVVNTLLSANADAADRQLFMTALDAGLSAAAASGRVSTINVLLEASSALSRSAREHGDSDGGLHQTRVNAALRAATSAGQFESFLRLMADPSASLTTRLLSLAAEGGQLDIVDRCIFDRSYSELMPNDFDALQRAIENRHWPVVELLLGSPTRRSCRPPLTTPHSLLQFRAMTRRCCGAC